MNIKDIAELCGLSKSTVSNYLRGKKVSARSAERIAQIIEQTGFVPNVSASRLRSNKSQLIGVLVDGIVSNAVTQMLTGISSELHSCGYQPFIMIDEHDENHKSDGLRALARQGVDAIVFGAADILPEHIQFLHTLDTPSLILGQSCDSLPFCKIDDRAMGRMVGEHVVACGAKRIVYLSYPRSDLAAGAARADGFASAFVGHDVELHSRETGYGFDDAYAMADDVIDLRPDFIVGAGDRTCYGVFQRLCERGLRVPEDVRLAGFGNYYTSALAPLSLTSVDIAYSALGRDVAQRAVLLAEGTDVPHGSTDYAFRLIERRSSGRL